MKHIWLYSFLIFSVAFAYANTPIITQQPSDKILDCSTEGVLDSLSVWYQAAGGAMAEEDGVSLSFVGEVSFPDVVSAFEGSLGNLCGNGREAGLRFIATGADGQQVFTDTAYFRVIDTKKPKIVTPAQQALIPCSETARDSFINWIQGHGQAEAEDACTDIEWTNFVWNDSQGNSGTSSITAGPYPQFLGDCTYFYNISFVVEDECGNESASPGRFTVVDGGAPFLDTLPQDIIVDCNNIPSPFAATVTDLCDPNPSLTVNIETTQSGDETSCAFFNYEIFYDYVAADGCGNSFTHRQTISVRDTSAIEIVAMDTVFTDCNEFQQDTLYGEFKEVCNAFESTYDETIIDEGECMTHVMRTHYFQDQCENRDTFLQHIYYEDKSPPIPSTLPRDTTIFCMDNAEAAFAQWLDENIGIQASDLCSDVRKIAVPGDTFNIDSLANFDGVVVFDSTLYCAGYSSQVIFSQSVDFVFIDACDNYSVYNRSFFIQDTIPPIIESCPEPITSNLLDNGCQGSITIPALTIAETCGDKELSGSIVQQVRLRGEFYQLESESLEINDIPAGDHVLEYIIQDCAGNISTCESMISIVDENPAEIVGCPEDVEVVTADCTGVYELPKALQINDDCPVGSPSIVTFPAEGDNRLLNFNKIDTQYFINNKSYIQEGLSPISYSTYPVSIQFNIQGPDGLAFEIQGEDGASIGMDTLKADCDWNIFDFSVDIDTYNQWVDDNRLELAFIPETSSVMPCDTVTGDIDGVTQAFFEVTAYLPEIGFLVEGATVISETILDAESINNISLNVGVNEVTYFINQEVIAADSCQFTVLVKETTPPEASCKNMIVYTWPTLEDARTIDASELDDESTDNCGIDTIYLSERTFDCSLYGQEKEVLLYVEDESGNIDSCIARVRVEREEITPTFTSGICESDTLRLFANVPLIDGEDPFTYSWVGPNGFASTAKNPTVVSSGTLSNDGLYTLTVTGFGGCAASGQVQVVTESLATPEIMTERDTICGGSDVILMSTLFDGNVTYQWYEGAFPNGALLATTSVNSVVINPVAGEHNYYLIVSGETCESNPSEILNLLAIDPPEVEVNDAFINICEGEDFALGTLSFGAGYEYNWYGPNGFVSDRPNPEAITSATIADGGRYFLLINVGGCVSDTVSTRVNVFEKPARPVITGEEVFCENATITLSVNNVPLGDKYTWYLNDALFTTTNENSLNITNAQASFSGSWTVVVEEGICESEISLAKEIIVNDLAEVSATNTGPACEGEMIQLFATFVANASYLWTGPGGFSSMEQNPMIEAMAGEYVVEVVTSMDCSITASTTVTVGNAPTITALSSDAEQCMAFDDEISFFPTIVPDNDNYTYVWSGPAGFASSLKNPTITELTEDKVGTYTLRVGIGNCESAAFNVEVNYSLIPDKPDIIIDGNACAGEDISIRTSATAGSYTFYTPSGILNRDDPVLNLEDVTFEEDGLYAVALNNGVCQSVFSDTLMLEVNEIPQIPDIITNSPLCEGDTLIAYVPTDQDYTYAWYVGDSLYSTTTEITVPDPSIEDLDNITIVVSQGDCSAPPFKLEDLTFTEGLATPVLDQGSYDICLGGEGDAFCISETTALESTRYVMYNSFSDEEILESNDACFSYEELADLVPGSYIVYFIAVRNNCSSVKSTDYAINISVAPTLQADIVLDNNRFCLDEDIVLMTRHGEPDVNLRWEIPDEMEVIGTSNNAITLSSTDTGSFEIEVFYSTGSCLDFSSDTAIIEIGESPVVNDETYMLNANEQIDIDVLENDNLPGDYVFTIIEEPAEGVFTDVDGQQSYLAAGGGTFTLTYEVCGTICDECKTGKATFVVDEVIEDCKPPSIITPNGDGVNDSFVIPCLSGGSSGKLVVFNEWGQEVYSNDDYNNDWMGTYNGSDLPVGTYYYILEINGGGAPFNGFLLIQR